MNPYFMTVQLSKDVAQEDNWTCLVSPEVADLLGITGDKDFLYLHRVHPKFVDAMPILPDLLKAQVCQRIEKNCVAVPGLAGGKCYLAVAEKCTVLETISLQIESSDNSPETVLKNLELVLAQVNHLPVTIGKNLRANGTKIKVQSAEPCQGLLDIKVTKTDITFVESEKVYERKVRLPQALTYTLGIVRPYLSQPNALSPTFLFRCWKSRQFTKKIKPCSMITKLTQDHITLSSTLVISDCGFPSDFGQLQSVSGCNLNVQIVRSEIVDRDILLVAPSFAKGIVSCMDHCWYLKPLPSGLTINATEVELSVVFSPVHLQLQPGVIDQLLQAYFAAPRYFDAGVKWIEFDAVDHLSMPTEHLQWKLQGDVDTSLHFRVDNICFESLPTSEHMVCISSNATKLSVKTRELYLKLPTKPEFWVSTLRHWPKLESLPRLPNALAVLSDRIVSIVDGFFEADHVVQYGPILLRSPHHGCGTELVLRETSHKLGMSSFVKLDCLPLVGETSGSTEAKIRAALSSLGHNTFLYLDNVSRLTRNLEDTATDVRVCESLRNELYSSEFFKKRVVVVAQLVDECTHVRETLSLFNHEVDVDEMSSSDRADVLLWIIRKTNLRFSAG